MLKMRKHFSQAGAVALSLIMLCTSVFATDTMTYSSESTVLLQELEVNFYQFRFTPDLFALEPDTQEAINLIDGDIQEIVFEVQSSN